MYHKYNHPYKSYVHTEKDHRFTRRFSDRNSIPAKKDAELRRV